MKHDRSCVVFAAVWLLSSSLEGHLGAEEGLANHWLFEAGNVQQGRVANQGNGLPARLSGGAVLEEPEGSPAFVALDGKKARLWVSDNLEEVGLPQKALTVTAWVRVDQPLEWGGIMGVIQDNGPDESGWLLGYRQEQFCFGLASATSKSLTYLRSAATYETGRWHHVAGVYDGSEMQVYVNGQVEGRSSEQSGAIRYPSRAFVEMGAYHDQDEYFRMTGGLHEVRVYDRALSAEELQAQFQAKESLFPEPPKAPQFLKLAHGPFVEWVNRTTARVSWEVDQPMPASLSLKALEVQEFQISGDEPKRRHEIEVSGLLPDREYTFIIRGVDENAESIASKPYLFDTTFYYALAPVPERPSPFPEDARTAWYAKWAERILADSGLHRGYCLIAGGEEGRLAYEIARRSEMQVVMVEPDAAKVRRAREALAEAGLYGSRVSVHHGGLEAMPYGPYFANLILSETTLLTGALPEGSLESLHYHLRPAGGVLYLGQPGEISSGERLTRRALAEWAGAANLKGGRVVERDGNWFLLKRGKLEGAGEWTHQYAGPDNSACSQDERVQGELGVLWWGEPGPRPMPDRGNRNPAPLFANGQLFVQGNRMLFGLDAYNGAVLWSLAAPEVRRANMIRDCSNMVASDDYLYLAQGRSVVGIEARTGDRALRFVVPDHKENDPHDWGYLSVVEHLLIGTAVPANSHYLGDDGEWYEDYEPNSVNRVISRSMFGFHRTTGEARWRYQGGVIMNSTITIGDGVIYFLESRNPEAARYKGGRIPVDLLTDQRLVALDLNSGAMLWESEQDFTACQFMTYMLYNQGTLMVAGTDKNKVFHLFAVNTREEPEPAKGDRLATVPVPGSILWRESHKEDKGHHSGHLQHPLIIGDTFYSDQRSISLRSGEVLRTDLPERRGCGTMAAAANSVFFRHYFHGMWDLKSDRRTQFEGIRSGCWLGLIPAGGMLLAPESSAGCYCTHSIQTSVAFVPRADTRNSSPAPVSKRP